MNLPHLITFMYKCIEASRNQINDKKSLWLFNVFVEYEIVVENDRIVYYPMVL